MADDRYIPYDPPLRNGVNCTHCLQEIQAVGQKYPYLTTGISGFNDYVWTHVDTGSTDCPPVINQARPYDGWEATRRIETAQRERWRQADEALDPGCPRCGDLSDPDQPNLHARCRQILDAETRRDGRDD